MDLVNLARTSKALRGVLMSRNSIWVWMVARRNAGITKVPDPPKDLSEPAWALLVFGPSVCSVRGRSILLISFSQPGCGPTALLYEEHPSGRLCSPSSLVHHLQEEKVNESSLLELWTVPDWATHIASSPRSSFSHYVQIRTNLLWISSRIQNVRYHSSQNPEILHTSRADWSVAAQVGDGHIAAFPVVVSTGSQI